MYKYFIVVLLSLISTCTLATGDSSRVILELSFVGDIMQHGPQIKSAYNPVDDNYDYLPCFRTISPSFREADIVFANLELTLAGKPFSGYPTFSAPDELAFALKKSGVDVLVTANNHSLDRRKKGLERTIDMLDSLKMPHTGTFKNRAERNNNYPLIIEKKGIRIALLNYTYGTNGIPVTEPNVVNLIDHEEIKTDLRKAKASDPDLIIVFTHWGWEYNRLPNKEQKALAKLCKEYGADLVIGSHPHVLQPIDRQEDFLVVYSLGNFVSNQRDRYKNGGMVFSTKIEFDTISKTKSILEAGYELTWVYKKRNDFGSEYFILPAAHPQSQQMIDKMSDRESLQQFVTDSRIHFKKHNKGNIKEYKIRVDKQPHYNLKGELSENIQPTLEIIKAKPKIKNEKAVVKPKEKPLSTTIYRIQFIATSKKQNLSVLDKKHFPGIYTEKVNGVTRYMTGSFTTEEEARDHLMVIINETKYKDAFIVKRKVN